jgi:hypothetical protein
MESRRPLRWIQDGDVINFAGDLFDMPYRLLADAVLLAHLAFILFVVFGALLVLRRRRLMPIHLLAVAWGIGIELLGAVCPLTYAENRLRLLAGEAGYRGGFIEHYVVALIYPGALTRELQLGLAAGVLLINVLLYGWMLLRRTRRPAA